LPSGSPLDIQQDGRDNRSATKRNNTFRMRCRSNACHTLLGQAFQSVPIGRKSVFRRSARL